MLLAGGANLRGDVIRERPDLVGLRPRAGIDRRGARLALVALDVGKRLWPRFASIISARGLTVLEIERHPREHAELFRLVQAMMDYDEAFLKWRYTHMRLAFRIIGDKVLSLKGVPAAQLDAGTREPLFPELWASISELTAEFRPTY